MELQDRRKEVEKWHLEGEKLKADVDLALKGANSHCAKS